METKKENITHMEMCIPHLILCLSWYVETVSRAKWYGIAE